jgi:NAD(P)-dependent dehydrogenase (short-subunit alcohol dehydrogenase family)
MSKPLEPIPVDLKGRVCVVTGATAGIGHEAAWGLSHLGAHVVMVGRTEAKAAAAREALVVRGADPARLSTAAAELGELAQVAALADELAERHPRIDVLLNNAGAYPAARTITAEGFETSWATNVLAYEVLTTRLLPAVEAAKGRIVLVASTRAGKLDVGDLTWERRPWNGITAYEQSKQANRMLAWAWARRLTGRPVTLQVAHPGGVATNIAHQQKGLWGVFVRLMFRTQRTPTMGADTLLWLAASDEVAGESGGFYKDRHTIPCAWKQDEAGCDALWELCQEQIARTVGRALVEPR